MLTKVLLILAAILTLCTETLYAQKKYSSYTDDKGQLLFSDFDTWYDKIVNESSIIGGEKKLLHQVGDNVTKSPWYTTNLRATMGIDIGQVCVYPEKRSNGYCVRMQAEIRKVSIIGLKMNTLLSGSVFLGALDEPFRSTNNPIRKFDSGIPYTGKPVSVKFDYKYLAGKNRVNAVYSIKPIQGADKAEFCIILQKRWEDEKGNINAIRIGGARNYLPDTNGKWVNDTTITVNYGDLTKKPFYNPKTMDLIPKASEMYARNSKGKMVPVTETAWDTNNLQPTHIVMFFTVSYDGINYNGSPESVLWLDNFVLNY